MDCDSLEVIFERVSPRTPSRRSESPICVYQTPTKKSKCRDDRPPDVIDLVSQEYESPTKLRRISSIEGLDRVRGSSRTRKAPVIPSDSENSTQTSQVSEFGTLRF
uniref:Uncharacterized protein n=1 Tax=Ditylenchus dipsaci TaxID=166011 RepID=A0A915EC88_9BILA